MPLQGADAGSRQDDQAAVLPVLQWLLKTSFLLLFLFKCGCVHTLCADEFPSFWAPWLPPQTTWRISSGGRREKVILRQFSDGEHRENLMEGEEVACVLTLGHKQLSIESLKAFRSVDVHRG